MKIIALILSFYFLALNALPCSDDGTIDKSQTEVTSSTNLDHNHNFLDNCAPFCTCHCCHVHTIDLGPPNFEPINPDISSENFANFESVVEEITHSLFQPPKV